MKVYVEKPKCTGCGHCADVCPVGTYKMVDINAPASEINADRTPPEKQWKGQNDAAVVAKFKDNKDLFKRKSVSANGDNCILCQACLIECEGECIEIHDESGNTYHSAYK
jgi:NAD-dependent dihydropyrimidine dehydrogenase PreA subunit